MQKSWQPEGVREVEEEVVGPVRAGGEVEFAQPR